MEALKIYPWDRRKRAAETPPRQQARKAPPDLGEEAFRPLASFVSRMIERARAWALDSEYVNGVLAAFHYLRSTAGEAEAMELLERRRKDR